MPVYEAEFEIPQFGDIDVAKFIEALREQGHPKIILRIDAENRAYAVNELAESTSMWWWTRAYDRDWWQERLRALRGKRAEQHRIR